MKGQRSTRTRIMENRKKNFKSLIHLSKVKNREIWSGLIPYVKEITDKPTAEEKRLIRFYSREKNKRGIGPDWP